MKKSLFIFVMLLMAMNVSAYDVCVDGIYYNVSIWTKTAEVTRGYDYYSGSIIYYSGGVVIPEQITVDDVECSVTSIGDGAFYDCTNMREIHSQNITPPTVGSYTFGNIKTNVCKLYVPIGSKNLYSWADVWTDFLNTLRSMYQHVTINVLRL